jgi:serralysin
LLGYGGRDSLSGGDQSDQLFGGTGADVLAGGLGSDVLAGGAGSDNLTGGAGADVFVFAGTGSRGCDRVMDYDAAAGDVLDFGPAGAVRADFAVTFVTDPGAGLAGVKEAHIVYVPTGSLIWVLVDGAADTAILVQSSSINSFDLL